jgi:hypothetical protein
VLAVAAADGSVALARLPGSVNILGAAPARFAPGELVLQCNGLQDTHITWTMQQYAALQAHSTMRQIVCCAIG